MSEHSTPTRTGLIRQDSFCFLPIFASSWIGTGILPRAVPPSLFGSSNFFKAELLVELIVGFTVDLDIRVDEVIERWAILLGR